VVPKADVSLHLAGLRNLAVKGVEKLSRPATLPAHGAKFGTISGW
jgi:hypothetical protein